MDFRILGSVEVLAEGQPLPIGGPKQRALLAYLLLNGYEAVSPERLIEELWYDPPSGERRPFRLRSRASSERLVDASPGAAAGMRSSSSRRSSTSIDSGRCSHKRAPSRIRPSGRSC